MKKISLPILPNAPLSALKSSNYEGEFKLRRHRKLQFVENVLFHTKKITYKSTYQNDQSNSELFRSHMTKVYHKIKNNFPKGSKLVEVGCGKGRFLEIVKYDDHFDYRGFDTSYEGKDNKIENRYLTEKDRIQADVVVLRHTLEHIPSPHKFLLLLSKIFPSKALIFIEVPQLDWIEKNQVLFDFTYEHVNYFNTYSLCSFFSEVIEKGNFFGGQAQYLLAKFNSLDLSTWKNYTDSNAWEKYDFSCYYDAFRKLTNPFKKFKKIWIWGGATKGVLFLKHLSNCDKKLFKSILGVVDINPMKQGNFTPSTLIKIVSPKTFFCESVNKDDIVIVMNPNYFSEVKDLIRREAPSFPSDRIFDLCVPKNVEKMSRNQTYQKHVISELEHA